MRLGLGGNAEQRGVSAVVTGIMETAASRCAFLSKLLTKVTVGFCTTASVPSSSSFSSGKGAVTGGLPQIFFVNRPNGCNTCLKRASFEPFGILEANDICFHLPGVQVFFDLRVLGQNFAFIF